MKQQCLSALSPHTSYSKRSTPGDSGTSDAPTKQRKTSVKTETSTATYTPEALDPMINVLEGVDCPLLLMSQEDVAAIALAANRISQLPIHQGQQASVMASDDTATYKILVRKPTEEERFITHEGSVFQECVSLSCNQSGGLPIGT